MVRHFRFPVHHHLSPSRANHCSHLLAKNLSLCRSIAVSTGYNLPCPCPCRSGLNIQSWSLLLDRWLNARKLCLSVRCSCILFRIIIFLLRVTVATSRKYSEALPWRNRRWSSRPRCLGSLSLLMRPLATNLLIRGIILSALGTALCTFLRDVLFGLVSA